MAVYAISGGTGTLGTALAKLLLSQGHKVRAIARNEHGHEKLAKACDNHSHLSTIVGDVLDKDRLTLALEGCDYLIHAAAMKVIPLCEYSPIEAIRTNIDGTINAALAALSCSTIKRAAFISTDKACSPSTLYGATKLCGERLWLDANRYCPKSPRFVAVRYGNVMGSNGSVLHIWEEQAKSGTITVTEPKATRFHFRLSDAVAFVLGALHKAAPGELWVPRLRAYRVGDLAAVAHPSCRMDVTGIRPGEKLHESMISEHESIDARPEDSHYVLTPGVHQGSGGWSFHSGLPSVTMSMAEIREELDAWERSSVSHYQAVASSRL